MLRIKNPEAHRLARELADLTGESLTDAVISSLRERIRLKRAERPERPGLARKASLEELMALVECTAAHIKKDWRDGEDPTAFLYDERGLPK